MRFRILHVKTNTFNDPRETFYYEYEILCTTECDIVQTSHKCYENHKALCSLIGALKQHHKQETFLLSLTSLDGNCCLLKMPCVRGNLSENKISSKQELFTRQLHDVKNYDDKSKSFRRRTPVKRLLSTSVSCFFDSEIPVTLCIF